jgi:hypothetical protein
MPTMVELSNIRDGQEPIEILADVDNNGAKLVQEDNKSLKYAVSKVRFINEKLLEKETECIKKNYNKSLVKRQILPTLNAELNDVKPKNIIVGYFNLLMSLCPRKNKIPEKKIKVYNKLNSYVEKKLDV